MKVNQLPLVIVAATISMASLTANARRISETNGLPVEVDDLTKSISDASLRSKLEAHLIRNIDGSINAENDNNFLDFIGITETNG